MNEQQGIKPYVIGLDLGGTNAVFGIVDQVLCALASERGTVSGKTRCRTICFRTAPDTAAALSAAVAEYHMSGLRSVSPTAAEQFAVQNQPAADTRSDCNKHCSPGPEKRPGSVLCQRCGIRVIDKTYRLSEFF